MRVKRRQIFWGEWMLNVIIYRCLQEPNNEKTNNGIHYKLQLLYSNGKFGLNNNDNGFLILRVFFRGESS